MSVSKVSPHLPEVNPEEYAFTLRDLADCRKQLAREREELVKARGEKRAVEQQLKEVSQNRDRWMRMAMREMHKEVLRRSPLYAEDSDYEIPS